MQGNLFESRDGGTTWTQRETGITAGLAGSVALADGGFVIVGLQGAVVKRGVGDSDFTTLRRGDRVGLNAVMQAANGDLVLLGEHGAITVPVDDPGRLNRSAAR